MRTPLLLLSLALLVTVLRSPARAEWVPRVAVSDAVLIVNDVPIAKVRKPLAGLKPPERTALAAHRLREVLQGGLVPEQVKIDIQRENRTAKRTRMVPRTTRKTVLQTVMRTVATTVMRTVKQTSFKTVGKGKKKRQRAVIKRVQKPVTVTRQVPTKVPTTVSSTVMVPQSYTVTYQVELGARLIGRGAVLLTASIDDAKAAGKNEPSELAESWADLLKKAIRLPALTVSDDAVTVPLKEGRTVRFGGVARGPITVRSEQGNRSPIDVSTDPREGTITLTGDRVGRDVLFVEREGARVKVDVAVMAYAAQIQRPQPVVVSGDGASEEHLARLAMNALKAAIQPESGATVKYDGVEVAPMPEPGQPTQVVIPVSASGPELLPVKKKVIIPLVRRVLPRPEADALHFSNNPERIEKFQTLYVGRLKGAGRLLYHHQSALDSDIWFTAELMNDGDEPCEVQVIGGDAGPVKDTVWVGYRVASEFLRAHATDSGFVVVVPPKSRLALQALRLPGGLAISGLMELRLLSGSEPLVRVAAEKPGDPSALEEVLLPTPLSEAGRRVLADAQKVSEHLYPKPAKKIAVRYNVGGNFVFLPIGRSPIAAAQGDEVLEGNYGVFYDIALRLENPTSKTDDVRLVFEASGGMAGAVFEIDGKRAEIPQLAGSAERTLVTYRMEPGAKKTVRVRTLPLSGSNYPVKLIIRS
jgi:hypothetical protein